eukprot:137401-Rhodomonas_salina.1
MATTTKYCLSEASVLSPCRRRNGKTRQQQNRPDTHLQEHRSRSTKEQHCAGIAQKAARAAM